jgi:hypothetical protein
MQMIEAVRLGRRAVDADRHRLDAFVANRGDGGGGGRGVAVATDEMRKSASPQRLSAARSMSAITALSSQAGTKTATLPGVLGAGSVPAKARGKRVDGRRAPQAAGEVDDIDEQIVEREQQEAGGGKQRQLRRRVGQQERGRHAPKVSAAIDWGCGKVAQA